MLLLLLLLFPRNCPAYLETYLRDKSQGTSAFRNTRENQRVNISKYGSNSKNIFSYFTHYLNFILLLFISFNICRCQPICTFKSLGGGAVKYPNAWSPSQTYQIRISGSRVQIFMFSKHPLLSQYGPHGGDRWCYGFVLVINAVITVLETAASQKGLIPHLVHEKGLIPHPVPEKGLTPHPVPKEGLTPHLVPKKGFTPHLVSEKGLTPHLGSEKGLIPHLVSKVQHFSLFGFNS